MIRLAFDSEDFITHDLIKVKYQIQKYIADKLTRYNMGLLMVYATDRGSLKLFNTKFQYIGEGDNLGEVWELNISAPKPRISQDSPALVKYKINVLITGHREAPKCNLI